MLHHQRGDSCTPDSYEPLTTTLEPRADARFAPAGGRPTNGAWPYFNVQWGDEGMIAAIGWPGQWAASFTRDAGHMLHVRGGQELTHFKLQPGEEVRTPLVVTPVLPGQPQLRTERLAAMDAGAQPPPTRRRTAAAHVHRPAVADSSQGSNATRPMNCDSSTRYTQTKALSSTTGGWTQGGIPATPGRRSAPGQSIKTRFPQGLRAISDHAHSKGIKLILWFEPERVAPARGSYENHPEWLLGHDGGPEAAQSGEPERPGPG